MVYATADGRAGDRLRVGMVGGGKNAFIGAVHRLAMRLDDQIALVAGALSWHLIEKRFLRKKPATSDHHAREGCAVEEARPPMGDVVGAA